MLGEIGRTGTKSAKMVGPTKGELEVEFGGAQSGGVGLGLREAVAGVLCLL